MQNHYDIETLQCMPYSPPWPAACASLLKSPGLHCKSYPPKLNSHDITQAHLNDFGASRVHFHSELPQCELPGFGKSKGIHGTRLCCICIAGSLGKRTMTSIQFGDRHTPQSYSRKKFYLQCTHHGAVSTCHGFHLTFELDWNISRPLCGFETWRKLHSRLQSNLKGQKLFVQRQKNYGGRGL